MKNDHLNRVNHFAAIMLTIMLLSLAGAVVLIPRVAVGTDPVTGAVWTSDPHGERVNGNLYTNARKVYLAGGPHKEGAAGLSDGIYYFQVTDPAGKTLLSTDDLSMRRFEAKYGYIYGIDGGNHKWNDDDTAGYGIVVQLWPFTYTPNKGGTYKVWVTKVEYFSEGQGCFGFIPAMSKTDNFKVGMAEVPKYFELWISTRISGAPEIEFYVNYTTDSDGDPATNNDPLMPWTTGRLTYDRAENEYDVFRYETSFALGTYIYWQFFVHNSISWASGVYGPELISQEGMVNKETLFVVDGHKFTYPDQIGLPGWTIELYRDGVKIGETETGLGGYYEFFGIGIGSFVICEIPKRDEGWAPFGPTSYEFTVDGSNGGDFTFDFYNYKMLRLSDTSDYRLELSSFHPVFTPSNDEPGMYKLSSTNPGSFYINVEKYGTPGGTVRVEVNLPPDQENAPFDSPNFILHHTYIGSTSTVDVHVYAGKASPSGWVPDWSKDVTNLFDITASPDGKNVTVLGDMPYTGEVFVTVHIDYQISASLTWEQVQMFSDFEYTFSTTVYHSIEGVRLKFKSVD